MLLFTTFEPQLLKFTKKDKTIGEQGVISNNTTSEHTAPKYAPSIDQPLCSPIERKTIDCELYSNSTNHPILAKSSPDQHTRL